MMLCPHCGHRDSDLARHERNRDRLRDRQIYALHVRYERGEPLRRLGREIHTNSVGLRVRFARLALPVREPQGRLSLVAEAPPPATAPAPLRLSEAAAARVLASTPPARLAIVTSIEPSPKRKPVTAPPSPPLDPDEKAA